MFNPSKKHPMTFRSELTNERLEIIAARLLDVRYGVIQLMTSPYDDNYTREVSIFGRSRNMIIAMGKSSQYSWMKLLHVGMDVTFSIGGVPCRFFRDESDSPKKTNFFKRNAVDDLFSINDLEPVMWRFVVERALTDEDEDQVHFVGYNAYQEKVSEWVYKAPMSILHSVGHEVPAAALLPPVDVDVREEWQEGQDKIAKYGNEEKE